MKGKREILKGHFHISTEELRSQVVEAEEVTTQKATKQASTTTKQPKKVVLIDSEVEEDIEELYNSDIDELGW